MARWLGVALATAALLAILHFALFLAVLRTPVAPHEREYLRTDQPAYHATPLKRMARSLWAADLVPLSDRGVRVTRWSLLWVRFTGLAALFGLAWRALGFQRASSAFLIFLLMPPALSYLVRADAWMDSVCFTFAALFLMSERILPLPRPPWTAPALSILSGIFVALALDSKLTSALTLVPAAAFWMRPSAIRHAIGMAAGILAGFALAQPDWLRHPAHAMAHAAYWSAHNSALKPLPFFHAPAGLISSIPLSIWFLALVGLKGASEERAMMGAAVLAAIPVSFFVAYRTVAPDGIRHLYLSLPFIAALTSAGLSACSIPLKCGWLTLCLSELWFRFRSL